MSFCNNLKPDKTPGPICGNPVTGLCERACLQVKKVFDACLKQTRLENYNITATNLVPSNPKQPLTFVSATSTTSKGVISNVIITPIRDESKCSRVQADITIPVEVLYVDDNNVEGKGQAEIVVHQDVVMYVPENSVIPVSLEATVNAVAPQGTYDEGLTFTITACVTVVLKVEAEVELLVPTYGYCYIPPCQEFTQEVCTGVFDMPLFPSTLSRR
ncbi:MAG: hypothetical protein RR357_05695 [Clostridia bacterium]